MTSARCVALLLSFGFLGVGQDAKDKPDEKRRVKVEFRKAETKPADGLTEAKAQGREEKIYLHKKAELTNEDIAEARPAEAAGAPALEIIFTKEGSKKIAALTEGHLEKPLAILADGKVIAAPIVRAKVSERAVIVGKFTQEEIDRFVKGINGK